MLTNLFITAGAEWTAWGMTVTDWVALLTFLGTIIGLLIGAIKLIDSLRNAIDDLNQTVKEMNEANNRRDADYRKLSEHLAKHDRAFIKDEERIAELFRLIRNGGSNDGKD